MKVDTESKTLGSRCPSFAFVDNVEDIQWTQVYILDREVQDPPPSPIPPFALLWRVLPEEGCSIQEPPKSVQRRRALAMPCIPKK